jgi:NADPH:quinone reductase-like Zn-dependent oxidoreductase
MMNSLRTTTMKAMTLARYGSPDELRLVELPVPAPRDQDVLVRVLAAGVDAGTWHTVTGRPYLMRLMGFGFRGPRNPVPGLAFAGRVEAVGAGVSAFRPGDDVFGSHPGAFAEYLSAPQSTMTLLPATIDHVHAAALPISGVTALQAVRDAGEVRAGQRVLVIGAAGGVGSFAVQLARGAGASVTAVCSAAKTAFVLALGAHEAIDYTETDITALDRTWDVIIDTAGNRPLSRLRRILAPAGTLVLVGGENGGSILGGMERVLAAGILSPTSRQRLRGLISRENTADLVALADLVAAGSLSPAIDTVRPLPEAAAAIRQVIEGRARGKVILAP